MKTYFISFSDNHFYYECVLMAESEDKAKDIILKRYEDVNFESVDMLTESDLIMLKNYHK